MPRYAGRFDFSKRIAKALQQIKSVPFSEFARHAACMHIILISRA